MHQETLPTSETLASVPLFEGLDTSLLQELATTTEQVVFEKGHILFTEGEPGKAFFVILKGRVRVYKTTKDGKEQTLHLLGAYEPFGEVPVFEGGCYPATAAVQEQARLLRIPRDGFRALLERQPEIALKMLGTLSRRLRRFTSLIEDLSLKEAPARLAGYLLGHRIEAAQECVKLEISHGELANSLGLSPETLSRVLGRMTFQGLVRMDTPRVVHLLEPDKLAGIARGDTRLA